jgi:hypothetical protein
LLQVRQALLDDSIIPKKSMKLLNAKAPPANNEYGQWGPTPLIAALERNQFSIAMELLKWGANPRICDRTGTDGFYWSCKMMKCGNGQEHWETKIIPYMIDQHPKLTTCKIGDGYFNGGTALHCAARFGLQHTVAYLLSRGSDGTARFQGGDDTELSACVIARNNGWKSVAKMLRVFTLDDWRDWNSKESGGLTGEASWLRTAGRAALGRSVRVQADNMQMVVGIIDDFDPVRGMHHVHFKTSNGGGNWEGWFVLNQNNRCQLLPDSTKSIEVPSPPPTKSRNDSRRKKQRKQIVSFIDIEPVYQRPAVRDAFERQALSMRMTD